MTVSTEKSTSANKALFLLTICTGSFLLFLVQPMIARMALPRLGGAPAVWNSAMLVYQCLLLAGYAYAHYIGRYASRQQAMIHVAVFALAAIMLPIGLRAISPPIDGSPYFWVPWLLISSIGPLFFAVSAQAPLMQRWFSMQGGGDPYPLYAASNLGSFSGLLAYPLLVEPNLGVEAQSMIWTIGYLLLFALIVLCALKLPKLEAQTAQAASTPAPSRNQMLKWIWLAAIPSGLMLSTTLHLTTDIVAMPLIWVIPLGLYLLSFSIAFSEKRTGMALIHSMAPFAVLFAAAIAFVEATAFPYVIALVTVLSIFVITTALHARMYDTRPATEHLTAFYLAMSIGGVVGGLFCALVAPMLFNTSFEHPILLLCAAASIFHQPIFDWMKNLWASSAGQRLSRWGFLVLFMLSVASAGIYFNVTPQQTTLIATLIAVLAILCFGRKWLFVGAVACVLLSFNGWTVIYASLQPGLMTRSFFGIYTIKRSEEVSQLIHGTTLHGVQLRKPGQESKPTTYYAEPSGVGLAMTAAPAIFGDKARIDVVGLGAGTLACYSKPGQQWLYYEIDPVIERIARDPKNFSFISKCSPDLKVKIGDARLVVANEPKNAVDLLTIDAFSSDSIPMHLLTLEAFETYRGRLTKDGLLMVHISNRYFNLAPVLAAAAQKGWTARMRTYAPDSDVISKQRHNASIWVALSQSPDTIKKLEAASPKDSWALLEVRPGFTPWTDSYGSVIPLMTNIW